MEFWHGLITNKSMHRIWYDRTVNRNKIIILCSFLWKAETEQLQS